MKQIISVFAIAAISLSAISLSAQDNKAARPSPPAKTTVTTTKGVTVSIDYSQPSVKGRAIGKEIAPFGQVWRTGANEATIFEVNKEVMIAGKKLPAGKYGLYSIPNATEWTIILNKKSDLWGSDGYSESDDAIRFKVKPGKTKSFAEKMTFAISTAGLVSLTWGDVQVDFPVE